jgi:lysophospholipase L1-like esterase
MALGDSKTTTDPIPVPNTWPEAVRAGLATTRGTWRLYQNGIQGSTVANWAGYIDSQLALCACDEVRVVLINLGANDVVSLPDQTTWQNNYLVILDAIHARFPNAVVYVTRPWSRGFDATFDTIASRIANVVAARSFAQIGDDERDWMKSTDDGATYTYDGVHLNSTGQATKPTQVLPIINH